MVLLYCRQIHNILSKVLKWMEMVHTYHDLSPANRHFQYPSKLLLFLFLDLPAESQSSFSTNYVATIFAGTTFYSQSVWLFLFRNRGKSSCFGPLKSVGKTIFLFKTMLLKGASPHPYGWKRQTPAKESSPGENDCFCLLTLYQLCIFCKDIKTKELNINSTEEFVQTFSTKCCKTKLLY